MDYGIWVPLTEEQAAEREDDTSYGSLCSARGSPITVRPPNPYAVREFSMENDGDVPLHRLRCLRGLYQTGLIKLSSKAEEPTYKWTVDAYTKQGLSLHPGRKQLPYLLRRSKTHQHIQNKPLHRYYTQLDFKTDRDLQDSKSRLQSTAKRKEISAFLTSTDSLPRFLSRPKFERTLLRRPTVDQPQPLSENDSMFKTFTKSVELKPRNFKTTTEQDIFYNKNYPLLLDAHPEEEKSSVVRKRVPTPEVQVSPEVKRAVSLLARLDNLEVAVDTLEEDTEDIDFRTVLREDTFYPQMWPWNFGRKSYCPPPPRQSPPNYGSTSPSLTPPSTVSQSPSRDF